jgi:hypothetical protein
MSSKLGERAVEGGRCARADRRATRHPIQDRPTWSTPSRRLPVSSGESPLVVVGMLDFCGCQKPAEHPLTPENKSSWITRCSEGLDLAALGHY